MKIGFILPSLANKGPILVVKELVGQLKRHDHFCHVFYFTDIVEVEMDCPVQKIKFTESIEFQSFDIIHTHGLRPDAYVFFHRPYRDITTQFISTVHNYVIADFNFQYNRFIAYTCGNIWMALLCRHTKIVTLSKDAMEYYTKWFPKKKLSYAYNTRSLDVGNTLSDQERAEILLFKEKDFLIGANTLLTHRKGIDLLIKVLPRLPQYKLCVVGDGKIKEELIALAKKYQVWDRCLFAGYKKNASQYLPYYDIYAMPSRSEGFPLALLEAMIYRKAVVCSDISVFREILTPREVVFFKLNDDDSLVSAINSAINDKELGERLWGRYQESYAPEKMYERYLAIYNGEV